MSNENIHKVWGTRTRILKNDLVEIDHLYINKNTCCSIHYHKHKSNRFYVINGKCKIKTELGEVILENNQHFDVHAPMVHQFIAMEDTVMIECAYIKIDENDIIRSKQGGKIINGKYITQDELKKLKKLDL